MTRIAAHTIGIITTIVAVLAGAQAPVTLATWTVAAMGMALIMAVFDWMTQGRRSHQVLRDVACVVYAPAIGTGAAWAMVIALYVMGLEHDTWVRINTAVIAAFLYGAITKLD